MRTILEFLNTQEYMREHLLLKGGTAINLTVFNLPRLSVDIDLDFIPNLTREETIKVRTVATMEIFAAKTNALISRAAARDLYDF